jgi:putative membrane protein
VQRFHEEMMMEYNDTEKTRTFRDYILLASKGFCMGASDVVPGVSGGTMAFILGIYQELIRAIRSLDLRVLKYLSALKVREALNHAQWRFLVAVGAGILFAIFTLARLLSWLLENKPILIWSFFFGLILASVYTVSRHLNRWTLWLVLWAGSGAAFTYLLVGLVPASTPEAPWFLFLSGAVAICAMILPGISGAFILVLLGKYHFVLEAVNQRDFLVLGVVAAGAGVGLTVFSRLLNWLFDRYHDAVIAAMTGLMLGSLRKIWPWKQPLNHGSTGHDPVADAPLVNSFPEQWNTEVTLALCLVLGGGLIVLGLTFLAERKKTA